MNESQALKELEALGTAQNRKVYARHGVRGAQFGVSYANLGKLAKQIKTDQALAERLWASGNHDARVLATLIADPEAIGAARLDAWSRDLDSYVLADALTTLAARSPLALEKAERWMRSRKELVAQAGWGTLSRLAASDELTDARCAAFLETIERGIHSAPNRVRHAMNMALVSIGLRSAALEKKAVAAARRIGKVEMDHGETGCKTPDAVAYIQKAVRRKTARR